jgi:nuclear pore complex protein Nup155
LQVPPFNDQRGVQFLSADIALLLKDWIESAVNSHSSTARSEFPAGYMDATVDRLLKDLAGKNSAETAGIYREIKAMLGKYF